VKIRTAFPKIKKKKKVRYGFDFNKSNGLGVTKALFLKYGGKTYLWGVPRAKMMQKAKDT
jgi:hypothetical protein